MTDTFKLESNIFGFIKLRSHDKILYDIYIGIQFEMKNVRIY
mgnify:CR=1 FL=1